MSETASYDISKGDTERWANPTIITEINKRQGYHREGTLREDLIHTWRKSSEWCININRFAKLLREKALAPLAPSPADDRWWVDIILDKDIEFLFGTVAEDAVWDNGLDIDFVDCLYTIIEVQMVLEKAGSVYADKVAAVLDYIVELSAGAVW